MTSVFTGSSRLFVLAILASSGLSSVVLADDLAEVRKRGVLVWGADAEGGGPYVYPNPADPDRMTGFEQELAAMLAESLGVHEKFFQGPWRDLPALLGTRQIDIVLNGYELTPARAGRMERTRPYYVYQLVLLARREKSRITSWDDLDHPLPGQPTFTIGVLEASGAYDYAVKYLATSAKIIAYEGTTDAMREVETGKLDATLCDLPAAVFYRQRFGKLVEVGEPVGGGYYVIFLRKGETALRDAIDKSLDQLIADGRLRELYEKYDLWNDAQLKLSSLGGLGDDELGVHATQLGGWAVIRSRGWLLVEAAGMTVLLAVTAMPLAMALGLLIALGRVYGPAPFRWLTVVYIEILRGTPLMLQLFVIFFLLPEVGVKIEAFYAAVLGLAINYSAYEAEIYRAGLQAVPRGQMEAALALGMSPALALRRIVIPQATRIVIPPVTNDFIAMFKDTSVCSVITVMELTKQYSVQRNDTGATLELAAMTALLYLLMSIPLARLATMLERRFARSGRPVTA